MTTHNFKLVNCDTDSIMVCKQDGSPYTEEEKETLIKELNDLFPPTIRWEDDGEFSRVVIVKAKNYILYDGKKIKIKGSSLKMSTKPPALKEFGDRLIDAMISGESNFLEIYEDYAKEICEVKDIGRWCSKKSVSESVLNPTRTNETKVYSLLQGTEYTQGDKLYVFFMDDGSLVLRENFKGEYSKTRLFKALYDTAKCFQTVLDFKQFVNYSLKRSQPLLEKFK